MWFGMHDELLTPSPKSKNIVHSLKILPFGGYNLTCTVLFTLQTTTSETSESVELLSQSGEETGTEWSGEFISENIGLAQGDQTGTEKSGCEYISEDGPSQELKLTRQLLTEANEKIIKLTNDNKVVG